MVESIKEVVVFAGNYNFFKFKGFYVFRVYGGQWTTMQRLWVKPYRRDPFFLIYSGKSAVANTSYTQFNTKIQNVVSATIQ